MVVLATGFDGGAKIVIDLINNAFLYSGLYLLPYIMLVPGS